MALSDRTERAAARRPGDRPRRARRLRRRPPAPSPRPSARPGLLDRGADRPEGRLAGPGRAIERRASSGQVRGPRGPAGRSSACGVAHRCRPSAVGLGREAQAGRSVALADGSGRSGRGTRRSGRRTCGSCRAGRGGRPSSWPSRRRADRRPGGGARPRRRSRGRAAGRSRPARSSSRSRASSSGTTAPAAPAVAVEVGGVGRAEPAGADRLGQLGLELPLALAELRLVPRQGDGAGVGDDRARGLEAVDQARRRGRRSPGRAARPRRGRGESPTAAGWPRAAGRGPGATRSSRSATTSARTPDRPPRADRELDHRPEAASGRRPAGDLRRGQPGLAAEGPVGPGREARTRQAAAARSSGSGDRSRSEPGDRRAVAAADAPGRRLEHPAAAERGRRALLAEHERLAVDRGHRLGQEELAERTAAGPQLVRLPAGRASPRPRPSPGGAGSGPGAAAAGRRRPRARTSTESDPGRLPGSPGAASSWPRRTSAWWTPARLTAARAPRPTRSTGRSWRWSPRTRTARPSGSHSSSSPTADARPRPPSPSPPCRARPP